MDKFYYGIIAGLLVGVLGTFIVVGLVYSSAQKVIASDCAAMNQSRMGTITIQCSIKEELQ